MDIPLLEKLGNNFHRVWVGKLTIWFSYETPIAFMEAGLSPYVRENEWSNTTARHMCQIRGGEKECRVPGPIWLDMLKQAMES